jgi:putative transposase
LAVLFRRVHRAYTQVVNAELGRSGHLWQNRFYSCHLAERHLWIALRYVEANPVRAGISAGAGLYRWSSAAVHLGEQPPARAGVLDVRFWQRSGGAQTWREMHASMDGEHQLNLLRRCTYAGRPFGNEEFLSRLENHFHEIGGAGASKKPQR